MATISRAQRLAAQKRSHLTALADEFRQQVNRVNTEGNLSATGQRRAREVAREYQANGGDSSAMAETIRRLSPQVKAPATVPDGKRAAVQDGKQTA